MEQMEQQNKGMTKDQIIQELIALLNQNHQKEAAKDIYEMAALLDGMEKKLDFLTEELINTRKQLDKLEQEKADRTLKAALKKSAASLEQQCQKMKEQLFEIKAEVKGKAAEIVKETKQKGRKALNKVSEFLGIKEKLQNIRKNLQESITRLDKSIGKIDALGTGMRTAMRTAANTIRVFAGKTEKQYREKRQTKTDWLKKPFQTNRKLLSGILNYTEAAIVKTEKLAADVMQQRKDEINYETKHVGKEVQKNADTFASVAETGYQYGAEAFETQQVKLATIATDKEIINKPLMIGMSR